MKKIETEVHIKASPERVWSVLVDFGRMGWNPFFSSIEGSLAVGERLKVVLRKPKFTIRPLVTVLEHGRVLEWRGSLGIPGLVDGRHVFELTAADSGTHLRHAESFTGILVPLLAGVLATTKKGFEELNRALKAEAEHPPAN